MIVATSAEYLDRFPLKTLKSCFTIDNRFNMISFSYIIKLLKQILYKKSADI